MEINNLNRNAILMKKLLCSLPLLKWHLSFDNC